jgi:hypothetical protein
MILDLSKRPVVVCTDDCPRSVVVRTLKDVAIPGSISGSLPSENNPTTLKEAVIKPVATMPLGDGRVCLESRLPIAHIRPRGPQDLAPDPFIVVTAYKNTFANTFSSWRLRISIELHKNARLWYVTVYDEGEERYLLTATAKDLDKAKELLSPEEVPIQRLERMKGAPYTAWDWLNRGED